MSSQVHLRLNGISRSLAAVSPNQTLLGFLRHEGLTGAKEECAEGDCGACSVALVERDAAGKPTYRCMNSCLMPVCLLAGREIVSVEGIANSELGTRNSQTCIRCSGRWPKTTVHSAAIAARG